MNSPAGSNPRLPISTRTWLPSDHQAASEIAPNSR